MRRTIFGLIAVLFLAACSAPAAEAPPDISGDWHGSIQTPGTPLDFGVSLAGDGGTFDLPAQGLRALALHDVRLDGQAVTFRLPDVPGGATFDGTLSDAGTITGSYSQGGQTVPFTLSRGALPTPGRPQEPKPPFPYRSEEVTYPSGNLTMAGTLTLPSTGGPFTAVLMITGSGAQDRDETIAGHKPFLLLADTLTRAGYAVLRVDDRGVGGSTGDLQQASYDDLTGDALAGLAFLRSRPEIDPTRIGLFGHSEGGYLAPLVAQQPGAGVAFVMLMAAPAVSGEEVLVLQNRLLFQQAGAPPEQVQAQIDYVRKLSGMLRAGNYDGARQLARDRVAAQTAALPEDQRPTPEETEAQLPATPAYRAVLTYDPAPALRALRVPVLAFYGGKDLQVPPTQSEPALRTLLAGDPDTTIRTFPALNHLMQPAATGAITEYSTIETTVSPEVLDLVSGWMRERF
ncbi:alpha/beta hydrolase family protein [Pseudonocardia xinjiangensis]|uniref:Prolyl oligopeptidase family serine peptidase n=1 Tax=Pseudonocardia xinjiangensis TaxID=75289 RepID=A0ABX1RM58_9PSEU|nr:alpha/beta fold hydrolase [Pseudonocardia xinjiangensis]NMH81467.1 prolyl oligopeptidase family serine peptidase [Pseudonocardia xinjiangensis]